MRQFPSASLIAIAIALSTAPLSPAAAQETDAPIGSEPQPASDEETNTIVVYASRILGQVEAPQPPILELSPEDIAAYGAGSISDLIEQLGSTVSTGRGGRGAGRPVILVNGMRISSFRELRSYPPEAIEKVEVFPEEVAQQYGYSPDQRVVNIILKDNYSSREIEVEYGQPFAGGYSTQEIEGTYVRIDGASRLNLNVEANNSSLLTEAERGIVQSSQPGLATDPDPAEYRSLVADSAGLEATGNWSTSLGAGSSLSLNATFEREDTLRLQGLDTVTLTDPDGNSLLRSLNASDPLTVDRRSDIYSTGATLNMGLGDWQLTGTLDASHARTRSRIERRLDTSGLVAAAAAGDLAIDAELAGLADAGFDEALTNSDHAAGLVTLRGSPSELPAGDVNVTFDTGYDWNRIRSRDTRNPGVQTALQRGDLTAGVNLGVPFTERDGFGGAVGDVNLNFSAGLNHLSDFGTLYDWSAGAFWNPTNKLTLSASYIYRDAAPSLSQLGDPEIATPNVSIYDLANGETVLATVITGGNPFLPAQTQSDWKYSLQWELPFMEDARFTVDYIDNHSTDVSSGFPVLTPAIEAAFPGRVTRDASGRLVQLDQRPVTFAEQDQKRLSFGLNLSGDIGGDDEERGAGAAAAPSRNPSAAAGTRTGNPEAMAQMRAQFCEADPSVLLGRLNDALAAQAAGGEPPAAPNGEPPLTIPPRMLERLTGADGRIDPERFAEMRKRICAEDGPRVAGGAAPGGERGARSGGGGRGGFGGIPFGRGRGGGGDGGRWFVNVQYNLELDNTVLIAPGVPLLDLLDGDALSGGGQPRHGANARAGVFYKGFGMFWDVAFTGASTIRGTGLPGSTDLFFDDLLKFDLRVFADLGQQQKLVDRYPVLDKTRISFSIDNLFGARQRVTDNLGDVPLRYQPLLVDPVGTSFEIELRKLF